MVDLDFTSFDIEPGSTTGVCAYDYIEIYDGPNTSATLIDRYCNENIPVSVSSTGGDITLIFHSNQFDEGGGFQINWTCNDATNGIGEFNQQAKINAFINANNKLELALNNLALGNYNVTLFNSVGQVIVAEQLTVNTTQQTATINVKNMAKGLYYINLLNTNKTYTSKLVR